MPGGVGGAVSDGRPYPDRDSVGRRENNFIIQQIGIV
jgi:hypothetical protein